MAYQFVLPQADVGPGIDSFDGAQLFFFETDGSTPKESFFEFEVINAQPRPVVADADGRFPEIFLKTDAALELQDSNSVLVYDGDVFAPESGITALAAANVSIQDTDNFYVGEDVELALKELGTDFSLGNINTLTADLTFSGANLIMGDQEVKAAVLTDYSVTITAVASISNTITLNMATGNVFTTTLTEDIITVIVTNPPASGVYGELLWIVTQAAASTFTIAWDALYLFPGGTDPIMTQTVNAIDEISLHTVDSGVSFLGNFSQAIA